MKKIIDISWPLSSESTEYKNRKTIVFETVKTIEKDQIQETILHFHAHSGTHIDLPSHMLKNTTDFTEIPLEKLVNVSATVLDLTHLSEKITRKDLEQYDQVIQKNSAILLKTKNSTLSPYDQFDANFVYLALDGAEYFVEKKISLVGIDYLGIERNQPGHPTHKLLLQHCIIIVEGLRLVTAKEGHYFFTCLPLAVSGIDALPARAILHI